MRNFGLPQRAGGPNLAGGNVQHSTRLPIALDTRQRNYKTFSSAALPPLPPLPAQSLRDEPVILDTDREIGATVFVIGFFASIPVALYAVIKFLE